MGHHSHDEYITRVLARRAAKRVFGAKLQRGNGECLLYARYLTHDYASSDLQAFAHAYRAPCFVWVRRQDAEERSLPSGLT